MLHSFFPFLLIDAHLERDRFMLICPNFSSLDISQITNAECLTPFSINLFLACSNSPEFGEFFRPQRDTLGNH